MPAFKFIGDPNGGDDPDGMVAFGHVFPKGEPVMVEDKSAIAKLEANSHFQKVDGRTLKKKKASDGDAG